MRNRLKYVPNLPFNVQIASSTYFSEGTFSRIRNSNGLPQSTMKVSLTTTQSGICLTVYLTD
jgi:hypothetical protein